MHMINRKDLNSAELEIVTTSRRPTTVTTANGEVQMHEEATVCQRIGYILDDESPRGYASSFYRWESFAMNTDTHTSGSAVRNHISLKTVFEYSVIRKISYQSWFLNYLQLPQARLLQHPRLLQVRKLIIQITIQLGWWLPRRRLRGRYRLGHQPVVLLRTETAKCRVRPT